MLLVTLAQEISGELVALASDDTPGRRERLVRTLRQALATLEPLPVERPPTAAALDGVADGFRAMAEHIDFLAARAAEEGRSWSPRVTDPPPSP